MNDLLSHLQDHIKDVPDFPKAGILFKDISPVFLQPSLVSRCVEALSSPWQSLGITKVIGIESRGFLLGPQIATNLEVGFVLARKQGKLPPKTLSYSYELEYGTATIEIGEHVISPQDRVLIHDDLLATGGTAAAVASLVSQLGADVLGFCFLIELEELRGREKLLPICEEIHAIVGY